MISSDTIAVGNAGGKALGDYFTFHEGLGRSLAVIKAVSPHTGAGINGKRSVGGGRVSYGGPNLGRSCINLGREGARNGRITKGNAAIIKIASLCDSSNQGSAVVGYDRPVATTLDFDRNGLIGVGTFFINYTCRVSLSDTLAFL